MQTIKAFPAAGPVLARRFVTLTTAGTVRAAGAGDVILGASTDVDFPAGAMVPVILDGLAEIVAAEIFPAGTVAADANGKAVAAAANPVGGIALMTGAADAIVTIHLRPGA